jgi:hypothetical protein
MVCVFKTFLSLSVSCPSLPCNNAPPNERKGAIGYSACSHACTEEDCLLILADSYVSGPTATSKQYVFEREMNFNELRLFWAAAEAASDQSNFDHAECWKVAVAEYPSLLQHYEKDQIGVSENVEGIERSEWDESKVVGDQDRRNSQKLARRNSQKLAISDLAGLFGCDENQVCQRISIDWGNKEPSCKSAAKEEDAQENDRNMNERVAVQTLGQVKQDLVPASLSSASQQSRVDIRSIRMDGRNLGGLVPCKNKAGSPAGRSLGLSEDTAHIGSPFPMMGVRTVGSSRKQDRKAWQALPSVVTWTGRLKRSPAGGSDDATWQDGGLRIDVFGNVLNVAARDWNSIVNSIGFWSDSGEQRKTAVGLFGGFNSLPSFSPTMPGFNNLTAIPRLMQPINLNIPDLDMRSSDFSPAKLDLMSTALRSTADHSTQPPFPVWSSRPSVVTWYVNGKQTPKSSVSTSETSLKYFSKLRITKEQGFEFMKIGSRASSLDNAADLCNNSDQILSVPHDTPTEAKENAGRSTSCMPAAENNFPSHAKHTEPGAAKAAQDAATAAEAAALEAKQDKIHSDAGTTDVCMQQDVQDTEQSGEAPKDLDSACAHCNTLQAVDDVATFSTRSISKTSSGSCPRVSFFSQFPGSEEQTPGTPPKQPSIGSGVSPLLRPALARPPPPPEWKSESDAKTGNPAHVEISGDVGLWKMLMLPRTPQSLMVSASPGAKETSSESNNLFTGFQLPKFPDLPPLQIGGNINLQVKLPELRVPALPLPNLELLSIESFTPSKGELTFGDTPQKSKRREEVMAAIEEAKADLGKLIANSLNSPGFFKQDGYPQGQLDGLDELNAISDRSRSLADLPEVIDEEEEKKLLIDRLKQTAQECNAHEQEKKQEDERQREREVSRLIQAARQRDEQGVEVELKSYDLMMTSRNPDCNNHNRLLHVLMHKLGSNADALKACDQQMLPPLPPLQIGGNINLQVKLPEVRVPALPVPNLELPSIESFTPSKGELTFGDTPQKSKRREEVMAAMEEAKADLGKLMGQASSAFVNILSSPAHPTALLDSPLPASPLPTSSEPEERLTASHQRSRAWKNIVLLGEFNRLTSHSRQIESRRCLLQAEDAVDSLEEGHDSSKGELTFGDTPQKSQGPEEGTMAEIEETVVEAKDVRVPASAAASSMQGGTPGSSRRTKIELRQAEKAVDGREAGLEDAASPFITYLIRDWKVPPSGFARGTLLRCQEKGNTGWFDPDSIATQAEPWRSQEAKEGDKLQKLTACMQDLTARTSYSTHRPEMTARSTYSTHWVDDAAPGQHIDETSATQHTNALCAVAHVGPLAQMEEELHREMERRGLSTLVDAFFRYGIQQLEEMIVLLRSLTEQDFEEGSDFRGDLAVPLTRFHIRILRSWWQEITLWDGRPSHSL